MKRASLIVMAIAVCGTAVACWADGTTCANVQSSVLQPGGQCTGYTTSGSGAACGIPSCTGGCTTALLTQNGGCTGTSSEQCYTQTSATYTYFVYATTQGKTVTCGYGDAFGIPFPITESPYKCMPSSIQTGNCSAGSDPGHPCNYGG